MCKSTSLSPMTLPKATHTDEIFLIAFSESVYAYASMLLLPLLPSVSTYYHYLSVSFLL